MNKIETKENNCLCHFKISKAIENLTEQEKSDLINFLWGYSDISLSEMQKFVTKIKNES